MIVTGVNEVASAIKQMMIQHTGATHYPSVTVGFTQTYGIYVHENLESSHKQGKQAKFLEQPARELGSSGVLAGLTAEVVKAGKPLEKGLLVAGMRLQREAMKLTPIDTGALRASAFTAPTREEDSAAQAAFAQSETLRLSKTSSQP